MAIKPRSGHLARAMVHVAGNVPHGYRNVGKTTGKVLSIGAPASNMIDFFKDIGIVMESASDPLPFDQMPSAERNYRGAGKTLDSDARRL